MPKLTAESLERKIVELYLMLPAEKRGELFGVLRGIDYAERVKVSARESRETQAPLLTE
jgi:hypothetical protein